MAEPVPIDAFISYRRSDGTAAARRIRQMLQAYRLPRSLRAAHPNRLTVFLDTAYERGAADFYENTIRPALMAARWLVVVATPDAVRRPEGEDWIAREVADFSAGPNAGNIVVVRALGEFQGELPADIATRYPNVQIVDLRDGGLAARLSPQRNARMADERLKLVGPVLGIALEDMPKLRREEERRQVGRLGALAGATTATVALVGGLSLFALKSQWDGSQALKQSLSAARHSVRELVSHYDKEEPLTSPTRDVVLQNCDLANRLRLLSGSPEDADQQLACFIEEQRALAITGNEELKASGIKAIDAALAPAEARARNPTGDLSDVEGVVLSGLRTWMALDPGAEPKRRYAAFERHRGMTAMAAAEDSREPEHDLRTAVDALSSASQAAYDIALLEAEGGNADGARENYAQAIEDALKTDAALQRLHAALPDDAGVVAYWTNVANLMHQAAINAAEAAADQAAAGEILTAALAHFSRSPADDFASPYRKAARRAALAGMLFDIGGDPAAGDAIPQALWQCLEDGHTSIADPAVPEDDFDRKEGSRNLNTCLDDMARVIDARRAVVNQRWADQDYAGGATLLRQLIEDSLRVNGYREFRRPWDDLYLAVAGRDLVLFETAVGNPSAAADARAAALALFEPYREFDRVDETAPRIAEARAAYQYLAQLEATP